MPSLCTYCGETATTRDHVVPYAYAGRVPKRGRRSGRDAGLTVPACAKCNSALGSKLFLTMEARIEYVQTKLGISYPIQLKQEPKRKSPISYKTILEAVWRERVIAEHRARGQANKPPTALEIASEPTLERIQLNPSCAVHYLTCAQCHTQFCAAKPNWLYCSNRCYKTAKWIRQERQRSLKRVSLAD